MTTTRTHIAAVVLALVLAACGTTHHLTPEQAYATCSAEHPAAAPFSTDMLDCIEPRVDTDDPEVRAALDGWRDLHNQLDEAFEVAPSPDPLSSDPVERRDAFDETLHRLDSE